MELMLANKRTDVIVAANCPIGMKAIKGYVRTWIKEGLHMSEFEVIRYSGHPKLQSFILNYALERIEDDFELTDGDIAEWQGRY